MTALVAVARPTRRTRLDLRWEMQFTHYKGEHRVKLDLIRRKEGEPGSNRQKNTAPHSHYPADTSKRAFHRKKGRDRFKTGRKSQRRGKK
jgi:hypothetical protein